MRPIALGLVVGLLLAGAATPALAQPLEHIHYSGSDSSIVEDACGHDWTVETTFSGNFMLKSGRGGDVTPYWFDNYELHQVWTAIDHPSLVFIRDRNALYKDLRITSVEGTVYRFQALEAGHPSTWTTGDGEVLFHDRGVVKYSFTIDTKGDADLTNDERLFDMEPVIHGPHPQLVSEDICAGLGL